MEETETTTWEALFPEDAMGADDDGGPKPSPQEEIYTRLRDDICLLKYPPGTVLREGNIAKQSGISRTPIREVMHRLEFDGLVKAKNGVGYIVTAVDFEYYKDIYEVWIVVAENIGKLSPTNSKPEDIAKAETILAGADALREDFDPLRYWTLNHDLHNLIGSLIGNRALREMWDQLYFKVARIWYSLAPHIASEVAEYFYDEVNDVVRALKENNIEAIGYSQRNHISSGLKRVIRYVRENPDAVGLYDD